MAVATEIVVKVSSNVSRGCPLCNTFLDGTDKWQEACNHLLSHGLKCLHVGQETHRGDDGPWHETVAVFGK